MSVTATQGDEQVLTFALDDQRYCVPIDRVAEIVDFDRSPTRLPDAPPHVAGVVDLRGRTTTVVDPTRLLGVERSSAGEHLVVFESAGDGRPTGWIVDEVHQVVGIDDDDVDEGVGSDYSRGVVRDGEGGFLVWLRPEAFE